MRRDFRPAGESVVRVGYHPPSAYPLDVEVLSVRQLHERATADDLRKPERIEFYLMMCVTRGRFRHVVDFEPVPCGPGSVLILRPGQVQRFDADARWDGWLVLFRPEFLAPSAVRAGADMPLWLAVDELPTHRVPAGEDFAAIVAAITGMRRDAARPAPAGSVHALLRHQLMALIARLTLLHSEAIGPDDGRTRELFRRFRAEVDRRHTSTRRVEDYARLLGCSPKTLTRTTQALAGVSAKTFVSERVALEAKRLLAHTALPISTIADQLGFDEPTNFIKFFRRTTGIVPGEFRQQQRRR